MPTIQQPGRTQDWIKLGGKVTIASEFFTDDCRGTSRDDVFVGRLWRSVKYGEVNLRAYDTVSDAGASIGRYLDFYVGRRLHSSVGCAAPDRAYFNPLAFRAAA